MKFKRLRILFGAFLGYKFSNFDLLLAEISGFLLIFAQNI